MGESVSTRLKSVKLSLLATNPNVHAATGTRKSGIIAERASLIDAFE